MLAASTFSPGRCEYGTGVELLGGWMVTLGAEGAAPEDVDDVDEEEDDEDEVLPAV